MFHDQRFYVALSFVLFFVIFGRKLWQTITAQLDARAEQVRHELDEAGKLRREAEKMLEAATREREQALADAAIMIQRSQAEAAQMAENARREAENVAARREQMARDRIMASERAAIQDVREKASAIATDVVREILALHLSNHPDVAAALVDKALVSLPSALRAANQPSSSGQNAA